jgi:hypothetical protein
VSRSRIVDGGAVIRLATRRSIRSYDELRCVIPDASTACHPSKRAAETPTRAHNRDLLRNSLASALAPGARGRRGDDDSSAIESLCELEDESRRLRDALKSLDRSQTLDEPILRLANPRSDLARLRFYAGTNALIKRIWASRRAPRSGDRIRARPRRGCAERQRERRTGLRAALAVVDTCIAVDPWTDEHQVGTVALNALADELEAITIGGKR